LIKQQHYKDFSLNTHLTNANNDHPSLCQMELTFDCPLKCDYCYNHTLAKNHKAYLNTQNIKSLIDDIKSSGVLWLCFTGGDPLMREDFDEIYRYAYTQGLLLMVFTSGFILNKKIFKLFQDFPPFYVEVTVNAATQDLYEDISGIKGSFKKVTNNLKLLKQVNIPLRIKTQLTKLNQHELPLIKKYANSLKATFRYDAFLHPALDGSFKVQNIRITPDKVLYNQDSCNHTANFVGKKHELFNCAVKKADSFLIDPYGNMFLCNMLHDISANAVKQGIKKSLNYLKNKYSRLKFIGNQPCKKCHSRDECLWCPGKAFIETGSMQMPIKYFCDSLKNYA
jgi:radical SAM protein with 4Fe4S-binding SPASM domain